MSARKPLFVAVTELLRHPGTRRAVTRSVVLDGLGITSATVPSGEPVDIDLQIESMGAEVVVTGTVSAPFVGECRRCLDEVRGTVGSSVREIFERRPTEGETYPLAGDHVDLEQMVRDAVLLALPLAPLCQEGCRGPAPDAFPAVLEGEVEPLDGGAEDADDEEEPAAAPRDPRWAALDELRLED